jgi:hypothetical protein
MVDAEKTAADAAVYGFDQSSPQAQWTRKGSVPWSFRLRRYLAGFIFAMLPPVTGKTVFAWLWLPLIACGSGAWFWFIGVQDPGSSDADNEFKWMAYVCGWIVLFILLFAPSAPIEDRASRRDPFRSGVGRRTAVFGGSFAIEVAPNRWVPIKLTAIKRVRRVFGVVAIELPSGRYWPVPSALFPTRSEWSELMDQAVGSQISDW